MQTDISRPIQNVSKYLAFPVQRVKESFLIFFLLTIGIYGIVTFILQDHGVETNLSIHNAKQQALQQEMSAKLIVQGSLLTKAILHFSVPNFQADEKYLIDFGNGAKQFMQKSSVHYSYTTPGVYSVRLFIKRKNNWQVCQIKQLRIQENNAISNLHPEITKEM